MASFKQHVSVSGLFGVFIFCAVLLAGLERVPNALLVGLWCWFAGMLPDIDSDTGRPLELIFKHLAACIPFLLIEQLPDDIALSTLTLVFVFTYYFVLFPLKSMFAKRTKHRGMFHSIPMGLFLAALICFAYRSEGALARYIGLAVFVGYLSHLALDEIFSVDLMHIKIKRSFGTALTFNAGGWLKTGVIVLFSILLWLLV